METRTIVLLAVLAVLRRALHGAPPQPPESRGLMNVREWLLRASVLALATTIAGCAARSPRLAQPTPPGAVAENATRDGHERRFAVGVHSRRSGTSAPPHGPRAKDCQRWKAGTPSSLPNCGWLRCPRLPSTIAVSRSITAFVACSMWRIATSIGRVALNPRDAEAYEGLARVWRDWGLPHLGVGDAHRATFYAPQSAAMHNTYGTMMQALGRYKDAKAAYELASTLDPSAAYAVNNLCYVSFLDGRIDAAIETCAEGREARSVAGRSQEQSCARVCRRGSAGPCANRIFSMRETPRAVSTTRASFTWPRRTTAMPWRRSTRPAGTAPRSTSRGSGRASFARCCAPCPSTQPNACTALQDGSCMTTTLVSSEVSAASQSPAKSGRGWHSASTWSCSSRSSRCIFPASCREPSSVVGWDWLFPVIVPALDLLKAQQQIRYRWRRHRRRSVISVSHYRFRPHPRCPFPGQQPLRGCRTSAAGAAISNT